MSIEQTPAQRRRLRQQRRRNKTAIPQAGPVTTTHPDGTRTTQQPKHATDRTKHHQEQP